MIFEIRDTKCKRRTLFIGQAFRAYEQEDGSVLLNDESQGYSFFPDETYEEFSKRLLTQQLCTCEK